MSQSRARFLGGSDDRREPRSVIDALLALAVLVSYLHRLYTNALFATLRMAGESGARATSQVTAGLGWESSEVEDEAAEVQQEQEQRQRERQEGLPPPPPQPPSKRQKVAAATPVSAPSPYSSKA